MDQDGQGHVGFGASRCAAGVAAELAVFFQIGESTLGDLAARLQDRFGCGSRHLRTVGDNQVFVFAASQLAAVEAGGAAGAERARGAHGGRGAKAFEAFFLIAGPRARLAAQAGQALAGRALVGVFGRVPTN
jgi:hypothetical protein